MILAFSVAPSGTGSAGPAANAEGSVSEAVAAAIRVVRESGLPHRTSSMFTEIDLLGHGSPSLVRTAL